MSSDLQKSAETSQKLKAKQEAEKVKKENEVIEY